MRINILPPILPAYKNVCKW